MHIPDCLIWAMGEEGCTAVKVYCEKKLREEVATRFTDVFNVKYEKLMDLIEEEEGDCNEKDEDSNPFNGAQVTDYGVFLSFDSLAMYCGYGDHLSQHDAGEAMEEALMTIKQEYPSISYEGYVAYCWSDVHSGDVCQYAISSEKKAKKDKDDVIYDFVGEALGETLEDDEGWDSLSDELEDADEAEFKKIIKLFHLYSRWLPSDAIDKVIEFSEDSDGNMTESLQEFADDLRAGKNVDIEVDEIDTSGLPDGYMEAMDMFLMAEEISGKKIKHGEILSSDGAFKIVIKKAESGDAEAKFIAGKYFLADHIEEEAERAIRWIREAAEAGVEEAEEYIEEHELGAAVAVEGDEKKTCNIVFEGKIFVLTGLDTKDENQVMEIIISRGGIIKSSTVLNTDYLIYDERYGTDTKKHERAVELIEKGKNIQMITVKQFLCSVK